MGKKVHYLWLALCLCLMGCTPSKQGCGLFNYDELNQQAAAEYLEPVHPGGVDGRPFWNVFSKKFIYAPSFDFKAIDGASEYRFTITHADSTQLAPFTFTASTPQATLAPVWNQIPVGKVSLQVDALDASGKVLGTAGTRNFRRDYPFHGPYAGPARSYREAALRALLYVHHMPQVQHWKESAEPDMSYELNTYVCKIIGSQIILEMMLAKELPQYKDEAVAIARNAAKFLMQVSRPEGDPLAYFPPTYYLDYITSGMDHNKGKTMTMEAIRSGYGFLSLYDVTNDPTYLDQAVNIARTYTRLQREDGSFPIKVDYLTGKPVNQVNAMLDLLCGYCLRLETQYGMTEFQPMRQKCEAWMHKHITTTFDMTGQFEDQSVLGLEPYHNLTNCTAAPYATYLLGKNDITEEEMTDAIDLIRLSEDQFVYWDMPLTDDGIHRMLTPCVFEQYHYEMAVDNSATNLINAFLSLYERTGKKLYLAKAMSMANVITHSQNTETGKIPTLWKFQKGHDTRLPWLNCTYTSVACLLRMDAAMQKLGM